MGLDQDIYRCKKGLKPSLSYMITDEDVGFEHIQYWRKNYLKHVIIIAATDLSDRLIDLTSKNFHKKLFVKEYKNYYAYWFGCACFVLDDKIIRNIIAICKDFDTYKAIIDENEIAIDEDGTSEDVKELLKLAKQIEKDLGEFDYYYDYSN